MAANSDEVITIDDNNADDARLDEAVNNAVQIPLTLHSLNKVINREWIDDATIDSVIYKDVIQGHNDRLMISAVVWNQTRIESWGPDRRSPYRLPTMPRYSTTFTKAVISVNSNNSHWSLAILNKNTKICTYYCTMRGSLGPNLQKIKLFCRLLCGGEECEVVEAPTNSFLLQRDGYNCGPMICMLAFRILNNERLFFGTAEANSWRQQVYEFYSPFVANTYNLSNDRHDSDIKIIEDSEDATDKIKASITNCNRMTQNNGIQSDATIDVKKGMKRKIEVSEGPPTATKHPKMIGSVKNDEENMILLSDEKLNLENEVKESFISFCNRKGLKKNKASRRATFSQEEKSVKNEKARKSKKEHYKTLDEAKKAHIRNKSKNNAANRRSALSEVNKIAERNKVKHAMRNHRNPQSLIAAGGNEINDQMEAHYLGPMDQICSNENCKAKHFKSEKVQGKTTFYSCCQHGKTVFPPQKLYPESLKKLFDIR
uniref:Ubiquitin-like protease family profile domain-containing protein n=1 Tax=Panagrolaimus superbus TaxID=310955 RepID=A0A914YRK1_9BILA